MGATNLSDKTSFSKFLRLLKADYPDIKFTSSDNFRWNSDKRVVFFSTKSTHPIWSLLHELGHMSLAHQGYGTDVSLLHMEVEAWQQAKQLGDHYGYMVDEDYIQDCIDSYRHWLHRRSTCPECAQTGVEKKPGTYKCLNCHAGWQVSRNRFCRVYRKNKSPEQVGAS